MLIENLQRIINYYKIPDINLFCKLLLSLAKCQVCFTSDADQNYNVISEDIMGFELFSFLDIFGCIIPSLLSGGSMNSPQPLLVPHFIMCSPHTLEQVTKQLLSVSKSVCGNGTS